MRTRRIKGEGRSFYHIVSRIVERQKHFQDNGENMLNVALMRDVEYFSGVEVIAYCFMGNHIHILLHVPPRQEVSEETLYKRIERLYGTLHLKKLINRWNRFRKHNHHDVVQEEQDTFRKRMYDMGEFMKTLKQRITMSYNARHKRTGTLWEERYKSILLEDSPHVLSAVAAYIDLNPVRANLCSDPSHYPFSSYGAASHGDELARNGLRRIYKTDNDLLAWEKFVVSYRLRLLVAETPDNEKSASPLPPEQKAVLEENLLSRHDFFLNGIAIGCVNFILDIYSKIRPGKKVKLRIPPILFEI